MKKHASEKLEKWHEAFKLILKHESKGCLDNTK